MVLVVQTVDQLRGVLKGYRTRGESIGFVPTMGYLHKGHLSLIEQARANASRVVVSIFVNPTQFNSRADFEKYPIDLDRDRALLERAGVDVLFVPNSETVYGTTAIDAGGVQGARAGEPHGAFQTWVTVDKLSSPWEGAHRPGHFRGVATVVTILFNMVQPDVAVFGEKDFQQLRLIEQMVEDLKLPIRVLRGKCVREEDGLAMSSRNVRLSPSARESALAISRGLFAAQELCRSGEKECAVLREVVRGALARAPELVIEYVDCASERSLVPLARVSERARLLVAVHAGGVRLIDNIALEP